MPPLALAALVLAAPPAPPAFDAYLRASVVPPATIATFLRGPAWATFDPELGYTLGNYCPADGVGGSATISTARPDGSRTSFVYADRPCRINTYGDSFTQCHQVSDGETWQEALAAHLGEPVRNFGMGGYGVYQAYRRMLREEKTPRAASTVVFYVWGDDPVRSLLRCRHAAIYPFWDDKGGRMFHNNFWCHLALDPAAGRWVEHDNPLDTPALLAKMSDPEFTVAALKDDLALHLLVVKLGYVAGDLDRPRVDALAAALHTRFDWAADRRAEAGKLLDAYSLAATVHILDKVRGFAAADNKTLLVVLFDPARTLPALVAGRPRYDQAVVDHLAAAKVPTFDMNLVHLADFRRSNLPYPEYMRPFIAGHYTPRGNHFFAHAIKTPLVELLDPKPVTYRKPGDRADDFRGYLPADR